MGILIPFRVQIGCIYTRASGFGFNSKSDRCDLDSKSGLGTVNVASVSIVHLFVCMLIFLSLSVCTTL